MVLVLDHPPGQTDLTGNSVINQILQFEGGGNNVINCNLRKVANTSG